MSGDDHRTDLFLDAVLYPHRSLSPGGFLAVMSAVALISGAIGTGFWWAGAWPVIGFLGVDVALIYLAFRLNYRHGRGYETVRLSREKLEIVRCDPWGRRRRTVMRPGWLSVRLDRRDEHDCRLFVTERGAGIEIGAFLVAEEKRDFAETLRDALGAATSAAISSLGPAAQPVSPSTSRIE
jgi:uncharacterized membrane protein